MRPCSQPSVRERAFGEVNSPLRKFHSYVSPLDYVERPSLSLKNIHQTFFDFDVTYRRKNDLLNVIGRRPRIRVCRGVVEC